MANEVDQPRSLYLNVEEALLNAKCGETWPEIWAKFGPFISLRDMAAAVEREREECAKAMCHICKSGSVATKGTLSFQWVHADHGFDMCLAAAIRSRASQPAAEPHSLKEAIDQKRAEIGDQATWELSSYVDDSGIYHCPCGAAHGRGPMDAPAPIGKVYRCLKCGEAKTVELRPEPQGGNQETITVKSAEKGASKS